MYFLEGQQQHPEGLFEGKALRKKDVEGAVSEAVSKHFKLAGRCIFLKGDNDTRKGKFERLEGVASPRLASTPLRSRRFLSFLEEPDGRHEEPEGRGLEGTRGD